MLDLVKLRGQLPALTQHLHQEAKANQKRLQQALRILEQLQQEPQVWQERYAQWGSQLSFTCASPVEAPSEWGSFPKVEPLEGRYTVVATDGSQIVPSHHEIAYCSLINVGRVVLHYGTQEWPLLDSLPVLLYRSAELHQDSSLRVEEVLALRRTQAEWEELAQLALAVPRRRPTLALVDGALIPWGLEPLAAEEQRLWLDPLLGVLERLRAARIPVVGYISASRSSETVNYLRLGLCPFLGCECYRYCNSNASPPCQPFAPLLDRVFWGSLLQPGERSPIWRSGARVLDPFGEHHIHCCYLNVSQGSLGEAEIARLEFPAWVAQDAELLQRALAGILSQVHKGLGYPVALAEAHHLAVVKGGDRQRFFALIEQELMRTGLRHVAVSRKQAQKRGGIA